MLIITDVVRFTHVFINNHELALLVSELADHGGLEMALVEELVKVLTIQAFIFRIVLIVYIVSSRCQVNATINGRRCQFPHLRRMHLPHHRALVLLQDFYGRTVI